MSDESELRLIAFWQQRFTDSSGVPKGSFHLYFPSKEAFGEALLQDYVAEYRKRLDALMKMDGTAAEKLMTFCAAWLDQERQAGLVSTCLVVKLGAEVADPRRACAKCSTMA